MLPTFCLTVAIGSWLLHCRLSVLAAGSNTQGAWAGSILLVFSNDTVSQPDERMNITIRVLSVSGASPRYTLYLLDDTLTNPAQVWLNAGAPVFPEQQLRAQLRAVEVNTVDSSTQANVCVMM
jgi:hypothetical protein